MAARTLHGLAGAWRTTVWFLRGVLGEDAYQHYLDHQARAHPGVEPLSERAFWKDRMDWQDRNPQGRCCQAVLLDRVARPLLLNPFGLRSGDMAVLRVRTAPFG